LFRYSGRHHRLFVHFLLWLCAAIVPLPARAAEPKAPGQKQHPANRLAKETSPYLLLHAHNPVDWFPWSEEAFEKAKAEGKLIFLSIGYSSCHWCHVMERESFMDDEIAALLNKHFVSIKVDREERPDVDEIYMTAVQLINRRGGWPLTVFLTPHGKPFYGGTYFPPRDKEIDLPPGVETADGKKPRLTGFLTLLNVVHEKWRDAPKEVESGAEQLATAVKRSLAKQSLGPLSLPGTQALEEVQAALAEQFDREHGGFGFSASDPQRPKFPEPSNLLFLLDRARRTKNAEALAMAVSTLAKIAAGGIRDHLGGGFHRYSVDRFWRIPHFEKMLYDNGQLATAYAEAYALTQREEFQQVADELLAFVRREMTADGGGFYTALDADTAGGEGEYYIWNHDELRQVLTSDEFDWFAPLYGVAGPENFERHWVLLQSRPVPADWSARFEPIRVKLLAARSKRARPLTDDKILTSSNGLMIRGFADAGRVFKNPDYTIAAVRAAEFVLANLRTKEGRLLRTYGGGKAKLNAYLDDYAFFIDSLIAIHRATGEARWLKTADELMARQIELFWHADSGGFFFTSNDHEELIARSKDPVDSAIPSGNAVAADNLVYLATALGKPEYLDRAEKTIIPFAAILERAPAAMPRLAQALAALLDAKAK
jgi:uncharacterized protein YyaL (SSP411 family)